MGQNGNTNGLCQAWDDSPVLVDAIQWMGLGLALVSHAFTDALYREVGPNAFPEDSVQREIYELIQIMQGQVEGKETGAETTYRKILDLLGIKRKQGEKLSDALLRTLAEESSREWDLRSDESRFGQARRLADKIRRATAKLVELARADSAAQHRIDHWNHKERQRREAKLKALLKSYLFGKARDRKAEAQQKWSGMTGKLESLGRKGIVVSFVRHLLITMHGHTKQRDVLKKVKGQITKQSEALSFLAAMDESADDYVAMLNPSHIKWSAYGDEARDHLWTIHLDLDVRQVWPVLFAVIKHFSVAQAKLAFKYLVNLSVRFLIVGGRGGLLDTNYAIAAHEIGKQKIKTVKALSHALRGIAPKDEVFEVEFANARVSDGSLARYYLRAMENYKAHLPSPEVMPIKDRNKLNLEHVLPENPGNNWPSFTEEDAKAYFRRIGNMVLLLSTQNSVIGNDAFATKKPVLLECGLELTKMVGRESKWEKEQIATRQKELAKLAVKTWPLDV